ncbi:autocrine proliferation repressor protein A-like [Anneissia japonica]|uniref:autocrine proliferation repressor protein A-like n=1 Tax=Anneissia japonica TaxID=1529436 RepID=UPI0014257BAB|nr:autocrine proliferation repressor protein A-like [Anneissia japonica]
MAYSGVSSVLLLAVGVILTTGTPLDDYVNAPDAHYSYTLLSDYTVRVKDAYTTYMINMTSQKWLTDEKVGQSIWWHYLAITIPDKISRPDSGFLYITGGNNNDSPPDSLSDAETLLMSLAALQTGSVCAVLRQVPNQPVVFPGDPLQKSRKEDGIIAYTWRHFIENGTNEPYWLLRMPMTKAGVRALDTMTDFVKGVRSEVNLKKFVVAGASKRGWTTWTLGAVDKRVVGIAPMVLDCLNFVKNLHHHYRSLGGWTFALDDYYEENVTKDLDHPNTQKMCDIVDPYAYLDRLTMPKYIISSSSDEFFLPDDSHYYYDQMKGPTYLRLVSIYQSFSLSIDQLIDNEGHNETMRILFHRSDFKLPEFTWKRSTNVTHGTITVQTDTKPTLIRAWMASTPVSSKRRDFRLLIATEPGVDKTPKPQPIIYLKYDVHNPSTGVYVAEFKNPLMGWSCFFIEATFPGKSNTTLTFTTEANIIPNVFPFDDCSGDDCRGILL